MQMSQATRKQSSLSHNQQVSGLTRTPDSHTLTAREPRTDWLARRQAAHETRPRHHSPRSHPIRTPRTYPPTAADTGSVHQGATATEPP
jgi:hypothetical protein